MITSTLDLKFRAYPLHPTAQIHPAARVGHGTRLGANVVIGPNVRIGENCVIQPGACIGQDGFGYSYDAETARWTHREHSGGVRIADDVHIGANTCIDQGTHEPTRIGRGTRIDNLVHIAHNAQIGEDCLIIALSMIAGSAVIGDRAYIAPCTAVREHTTIGEDALIGLGAVVLDHVPGGTVAYGVPARAKRPANGPPPRRDGLQP